MHRIEIKTHDGICPCHGYRPMGSGPWPAILVFMDGIGIRDTPVYDAAASERHWQTMIGIFDDVLKRDAGAPS
jgi:dienelactone hydrolase